MEEVQVKKSRLCSVVDGVTLPCVVIRVNFGKGENDGNILVSMKAG